MMKWLPPFIKTREEKNLPESPASMEDKMRTDVTKINEKTPHI